jgi:hypothetical protein
MADHSFGREYRIRSKREIDRVFARRCSVADDCIIIYGCENGLDIPRLAIVASRKLGKTVFRNRWKRLIREVFRQNKTRISPGIDYVVIPKRGVQPNFHVLFEGFPRLGRQLKRRLERSAGQGQGEQRPVLSDRFRPETPSRDALSRHDREAAQHLVAQSSGGREDSEGVDQAGNRTKQQGVSNFGKSAEAWPGRVVSLLFRVFALLDFAIGSVLILLVVIYRWTISPLLGRCCRFEPSCSQYFIQAVRKYGVVIGSLKGVARILRCHPWHPGGYDPP